MADPATGRQRFLHAFKWSLAGELASTTIQPLIFIVVARLLTSEDYGVMAAAAMVISFSQLLWEAGLNKAVIQRQTETADAANAAFWINVTLGVIVVLVLIALAGPIATTFFGDARVVAVLRVMTAQVFLGALSSVQVALLQKDLRFKRLFLVRLLTAALPGLASIVFALNGMGYWALVAGALVAQAVQVVVLWRMSEWRPRFSFNGRIARQLAAFGKWVAGEGMLGWFYIWADSLIVGMAWGTRELGFYWTGNHLVLLLFGTLFHPLLPVLFSTMARIGHDRPLLQKALLNAQVVSFAVSLPAGLACFFFGDSLVHILGQKWAGIGPVISILGLMHGLSWLMGVNPEVYKAVGRPDVFTKIMGIGLIYYIPGYYVAARYGLTVFLWTRLALFVVSQVMHFYALQHVVGISPRQVFRNIAPILGAAALYVAAYALFARFVPADDALRRFAGMTVFACLVVISYVVFLRQHPLLASIRSGSQA